MLDAGESAEVRLVSVRKLLSEFYDDKFCDYFLALAPSPATMRSDFSKLNEVVMKRRLAGEIARITAKATSMAPEALSAAIKSAQEDVNARYEAARDALTHADIADYDNKENAASENDEGTDESLLDMPGFVNTMVDFTMATAPRPNKVLAFAGAVALLAHLAGRKFYSINDTFPNIYIVALAGSGVGKDHPRKVNKSVVMNIAKMPASIIDSIASGQAIEDRLIRSPTLLCQYDEFHKVLSELKNGRPGNTATEAMARILLSLFTSSATGYTTRIKATGKDKDPSGVLIGHPSFSILATSIPSLFYKELSIESLTGGFIARTLVFETMHRGEFNKNAGIFGRHLPPSALSVISDLVALPPNATEKEKISPRFVPLTKEAEPEFDRVLKESDALCNATDDEMARSVWNRSMEIVNKFSLLRAISADIYNPQITAGCITWAWKLVKTIQLRMIEMAREYATSDRIDEKVGEAMRLLRKAGRKGILRSKLSMLLRVSARDMDEIENTIEDRDEVVITHPPSKNGKGTLFVIKPQKGKRK